MPGPTQTWAAKFKGTHDIGGVAAALVTSSFRGEFKWKDGDVTTPSPFDGKDVSQIYEMRQMNCFEFVHYCAYLAGINRVIGANSTPYVVPGDTAVIVKPMITIPGTVIASVSSFSKGALVAGVKTNKKENNPGGFFHMGIATGVGTTVVHLIAAGWAWQDDLKSAPLMEWFDNTKYASLMLGSYDWKHSEADTFVAPLPSYGTGAAAGVAAVGSPSVAAVASPTGAPSIPGRR